MEIEVIDRGVPIEEDLGQTKERIKHVLENASKEFFLEELERQIEHFDPKHKLSIVNHQGGTLEFGSKSGAYTDVLLDEFDFSEAHKRFLKWVFDE